MLVIGRLLLNLRVFYLWLFCFAVSFFSKLNDNLMRNAELMVSIVWIGSNLNLKLKTQRSKLNAQRSKLFSYAQSILDSPSQYHCR